MPALVPRRDGAQVPDKAFVGRPHTRLGYELFQLFPNQTFPPTLGKNHREIRMLKMKGVFALGLAGLLSACATPTVVQTKQSQDSAMSCPQLQAAYAEAQDFEAKARKERGATATNVAAAVFFWPALLGTYKNVEEAIEAAKDRQKHLEKIGAEKGCKVV